MGDINASFVEVNHFVQKSVAETLSGLKREVARRAYGASNDLRNASQFVLRGQRSGRRYRIPFSSVTYQASAPGEPPAVRTGIFRLSWSPNVVLRSVGKNFEAVSQIKSATTTPDGTPLGEILENGTKKKRGGMAPRPYKQKIIDRALPKIQARYDKGYNL